MSKRITFIGEYPAKTDAKGRVFLPAPLRKVLEAEGETKLVLRHDLFQPCLVLYPWSEWETILDEMYTKLNRWNKEHEMLRRMYLMYADEIELDSNGRFLISKKKMQYAGIESDVRFVGLDNKIEVWSKDKLDELMEENMDLGQMLQKTMSEGDLSELLNKIH